MHDGSSSNFIGEIEAALDATAEWLIAVYGARLVSVHLTLEGYYSRDQVFHGLLPLVEHAAGETPDKLPFREIRDRAEAAFIVFCPRARIARNLGDVREVASSRRVTEGEISAHRRLDLLRRLGDPADTPR
ncbi:MAG: hypothetical protein ABTQ27_09495 [Amaricoccus sp.]|uniref:hypothetical protein n=1 Tax=Amaricoccus sp. TaxID=1872485 RepID=UPI00331528BE